MMRYLLLPTLVIWPLLTLAQIGGFVDRTDLSEYVDPPSYSFSDGAEYNNSDDLNHPDFGKLTFQSPMDKNVVEVISKRKLDERYYVDIDNPQFFYIEKAASPINMKKDGYIRAIDPSLHPDEQGGYTSGVQPVTTRLDINNHKTAFLYDDNYFRNNNFQLKILHYDDTEEIIDADWSDMSVHNFGAYITNIFPSIDMKMEFSQGKIKSDFIIKSNPNVKELVFIDNLEMSSNLHLFHNTSHPIGEHFVEVTNSNTGETDLLMRPPITYDASETKNSWVSEIDIFGNSIHISCDSAHLNDANVDYPITVDPTFVAVGPVASAFGVMGSLGSPSFCSNNLVVNFPAGSTPWDSQFYWEVYSDFCAQVFIDFGFYADCWMSEAQVWVTSGCGSTTPTGAPGTVWTCPGCNNIGTWSPTIGFNASGTQTMTQCFSPSCSSQNLTYTINLNRTYCASAYGYDDCVWANSYCQSLDQWSVTVQGRTVETLGNTVTGNGSTNIYDADCAGTQTLDPTPQYGVGPYTYSWSTGGTSATETVPGSVGTYTCDVTDACGNTVTATFDIGCPLSINLVDFTAEKLSGSIVLDWSVEDESEIVFYQVEKSLDGKEWRTLSKVENNGGSIYETIDQTPVSGKNYYRLEFHKKDGSTEKSEVVEVDFIPEMKVYPNPANSSVTITLQEKAKLINTQIVIRNMMGKEVVHNRMNEKTQSIDISSLEKGVYVVFLIENNVVIETQRLSVK